MERIEKAEKLMQKTGITYEEARKALEESNWDLLDAMVHLENNGKVNHQKEEPAMEGTKANNRAQTTESLVKKVVNFVKSILDAGNRSHFIIKKDSRQVMEIPVTIAVLLFIFLNWVFLAALGFTLILGYRYHFRGQKENAAYQKDVREAEEAAEQINQHHAVNSL